MIRNEKGVALGAAMIFMVSVGLGSFYLLKSSQESSSISSREIKDIRARSEAKKVFFVRVPHGEPVIRLISVVGRELKQKVIIISKILALKIFDMK